MQAERLNAPHPRPPCAPGRKGWRRQAPASAAPHAATAACALGRAAPSHLGAQVRRCQVPASLRGKRALVAPAPLLDTPDSTPGFRFTSLLLSLARARGGRWHPELPRQPRRRGDGPAGPRHCGGTVAPRPLSPVDFPDGARAASPAPGQPHRTPRWGGVLPAARPGTVRGGLRPRGADPPAATAGARGAQRCRPLTERLRAGTALAFWREFACGQCCVAKPAPSSHYTLLYL